jgi:hypothetical protein
VGLTIIRHDIEDTASLHGFMRVWAREKGSKIWRLDYEAENILVNQWYLDLFAQIQPTPPGGMNLTPNNIALGYGVSPTFARPDTVLKQEWTSTIGTLTIASGTVATTSLTVTALPFGLANNVSVTLGNTGTPQVLNVTPAVLSGATNLTVTSFVPNQNWPVGTPIIYVDNTVHVPQRPSIVLGSTNSTDPVSGTWSYYLPASANSVPFTFTEAGLVYNTNTKFMSHVAFSYTKNGNTDLRIDYTLTRSST